MRATMHGYLTAQPSLTAYVPVGRWWQAGNVVDNPPKPFVVLRWLAPVASVARGRFLNQLQVAMHDNRGSYKRIDDFLFSLRPIMNSLINVTGTDGYIVQADYLGDSGDQEDPDYMTNVKFGSYQVIGVRQ